MIGIVSRGIARIHNLAHFLGSGVKTVRLLPFINTGILDKNGLTAMAGWGKRPSADRSRSVAARLGLPFIALEDGFLRSVGLGVHDTQPLSLVADDVGIYYDATMPSRLEALITAGEMTEAMLAQAAQAMALIGCHQISKYNHAPDAPLYPECAGGKILVVDQTLGDMSVLYGGATRAAFHSMMHAALKENPVATVYVKVHPDVVAGKKYGCIGNLPSDKRIVVLSEDVNPLSLMGQMDKVYVATSQMGFEALILGKPVVCFGMPWYAGWGLTDDRHPRLDLIRQRRTVKRTVEQLFAAAYLQYARYIHPETGKPGTIFDVIDHLIAGKRSNSVRRGTLYCVGMSMWKKAAVAPFLAAPSSRMIFVRSLDKLARTKLADDAKLIVWGRNNTEAVEAFAAERKLPVLRMEDGFLRSIGLGSDLRRPLSLVLDPLGIYYDAQSPSALEDWLMTTSIDKSARMRISLFVKRLVALKLSKYNVGQAFTLGDVPKGKRVFLVPGQVEDDASIRFGSPVITTNARLLEAVRSFHPDAYIVYKPHPDVITGNRKGTVEKSVTDRYADAVAVDADIIDCIIAADEIHTMTSQAGFEGLLYGKPVSCYGFPFYAGWGLTADYLPPMRQRKEVDLATLAYGALIAYPDYIDPATLQRMSAEQALTVLEETREMASSDPLESRGRLARYRRRASELVRTLRWNLTQ